MKRKNIVLYIAIALCLIACLLVFIVKKFELNIIKYDSIQVGELSVKYYGDFDGVGKVKIYNGSIRRGTFELRVDKDILDNLNETSPYLDDINGDGHEDILIPHSKDSNLDVRYAAFLWNNDIEMFEASEALKDIANISIDDEGVLSSDMTLHHVTFPAEKNIPEEYEKHYVSAEYKLIEGNFKPLREYTLIYYSENDIYCYVKKDYNTESGELISFEEDWMSSKEAEQIKIYK